MTLEANLRLFTWMLALNFVSLVIILIVL